jgi:hypothetical protein
MRTDQALKRKIEVDGTEWTDLVSLSGIKLEKGTVEVPSFDKIRTIQNGIRKIPPVVFAFKVVKGSKFLGKAASWFSENETHDVVIKDCDATGTTFFQYIASDCECSGWEDPDYDAANPGYSKLTITLLPYDLTPVQV